MENCKNHRLVNEDSPSVLPISLIKVITEHEVVGFHAIQQHNVVNDTSTPFDLSSRGSETIGVDGQNPYDLSNSRKRHFVSISMPPSPVGVNLHHTIKGLVGCNNEAILGSGVVGFEVTSHNRQTKFYSQTILNDCVLNEAIASGKSISNMPPRNCRTDVFADKRFDPFKTWSGKLEDQIANLRGMHRETDQELETRRPTKVEILPADRYCDALEGPELDTLKASDKILLPKDEKWPFLLRFPISSFGICLGVSSQAVMWKALATSDSTRFLRVNLDINLVLWYISIALTAIVSSIYCLKLIFYFEAVHREYCHPIRISFFFAPWITLLFLTLGVPPSVSENPHVSLWYILMTPIFCLELKIYGQWMSGGQQRLSKVANPSNHLSIVGNFLGALLGASMGLKEGPIFFFGVGLAHYIVLFVTLYQRLPMTKTLPKDLHPVFFQFVAVPSVASMAWARIQGSFDCGARIAYFIALFLYFSLAVRVNFFRGFRFSLAWWAYTFPMTGAAIATIRYSTVVTNMVTKCLTVVLCTVATLTVVSLLITTIIHAFVLGDLFPNDVAIAIGETRPKPTWKWYPRRNVSSGNNDTEASLVFKEINKPSQKVLDELNILC